VSDLLGIHHVSAIASDPQRNVDFYAGLLGLRLVKKTVNFDDPRNYHLYYGDEVGTPGSIMTFFPWSGAQRGQIGIGQVAVTSFSVLPSAIGFWLERLARHNVAHEMPVTRGGSGDEERVIAFRDHDGTMLEIVGHHAAERFTTSHVARDISRDHALRGFHSVTLWVDAHEKTERALVDTLGFRPLREHETTRRYAIGDGGPGALVDVRAIGGFIAGADGAGTVHHVAWSVPDDDAEHAVRTRVIAAGMHPTPVIDRMYFHSVYFREPGHVLFELATRAPGFDVDEPVAQLGERLMLPPQFEPMRAELEATLPPIHAPGPPSAPETSVFADIAIAGESPSEDDAMESLDYVHQFIPAATSGEATGDANTDVTLLLLHGTGGDEHDLLPLGRALLPGAAMLSPRGNVLERGMPRFFRRLAEGVFDQEDLARRTDELATFIARAARHYGLRSDRIIAVGFSNGANIAASVLLRRPGLLRSAVLLSPMVPFEPEPMPDLAGTAVFIGAGRTDPIAPPAQTERLAEILRAASAEVELFWEAGGHGIGQREVSAARAWVERHARADANLENPLT